MSDFLLLEDDSGHLLLEDGDSLLLESSEPPTHSATYMRLEVWRLPANEFVCDLTSWFGTPMIDHPHSGLGAMDVVVPLDAAELELIQCPATGPTDYIRFYDDDRLVGSGLVERIDIHTLDPGEGSKLTAKLAGRSVNALTAHALVFPAAGVDKSPVQVDRLRSWQSADYDATGWVDVKEIAPATGPTRTVGVGVPVSGPPAGAPQIPGAFHIWDTDGDNYWAPGGTVYAVRDFEMVTGAVVEIGVAIDNYGSVWIDEIQAFTLTPDGGKDNFLNLHRVTIGLSEGWHRIAVVATNNTSPEVGSLTHPNPATIFAYAATLDNSMEIAAVLTVTDDSWSLLGYPEEPPGMTAGQAVELLLLEEQARGRLTFLSWDFDEFLDTYGVAWNRVGEISTRVGNSLALFLGELQTSYVDWRITPDCTKLEMVNLATYREVGDSAIVLEAAPPGGSAELGQLTALDRTQISGTGGLLVRWGSDPGGWSWVGGEGSAATLGVPHLTSRPEAVKQSTDELARLSNGLISRKVSIDPTSDKRPGEAFGQGDAVLIEDVEYRVNIVYTADAATSRTIYALTLGEPDLSPAARSQLSDSRMATGTVGRRSQIASPIIGLRGTSVGDTPAVNETCIDILHTYLGRSGSGSVSIPNGGGSTTSVASLLSSTDDGGSTDVAWDNTNKRFDVLSHGIYHVRLMAYFNGQGGWSGLAEMFNAGPDATSDYYTAQLVFGGSIAELSIWYTRTCNIGDTISAVMSLWQNSGSARACTYAEAYVYSMVTGCGTSEDEG